MSDLNRYSYQPIVITLHMGVVPRATTIIYLREFLINLPAFIAIKVMNP